MNIDVKAFMDSLQYMGKGMLGVFIVMLVIILMTVALNKVTAMFGKKEK